MQKLRCAGLVSTICLLGHTLDHNTHKFILSLGTTFYENMTNLSRFCRRFCACLRHHPSDVPSLQRTLVNTNATRFPLTRAPKMPDTGYYALCCRAENYPPCPQIQTFRAFSARELTRGAPPYRLASSTCHRIRAQHGAISRDAKPLG